MANAMKKLKLLHHLTAASTTTTGTPPAAIPTAAVANNGFPTPPTSPQSTQSRHYSTPATHYTDVFRSARAALQTLHHAPPSQPRCVLPGGFMVLTPVASQNDSHPALCVPASPQQQHHPHQYSSFHPFNQHHNHPQQQQQQQQLAPPPKPTSAPRQSHKKPQQQRLTKDALSRISKDTRMARWERVLGYVRSQRLAAPPSPHDKDGVAWPAYTYGSTTSATSTASPARTPADRARRAAIMAEIDRRAAALEDVDREMMDSRSLWSGGSAGTDGVDEFVWSEDEDDAALPTPAAGGAAYALAMAKARGIGLGAAAAAGAKHLLQTDAEEEDGEVAMFEMESHRDADEDVRMAGTQGFRPKSFPQTTHQMMPVAMAAGATPADKPWAQEIEDPFMPPLCREAELDGGLGRLRNRRMSAGY